jgi:hypothetical protein
MILSQELRHYRHQVYSVLKLGDINIAKSMMGALSKTTIKLIALVESINMSSDSG